MAYIVYRGADQVSKVTNELAGSFCYYAEAEDALNNHKFVQKIHCYEIAGGKYDKDFLGKRCKII